MKLFLYFADMIGLDVLDHGGQWVGALVDLSANPQGDIYPRTTELIIRRGLWKKEYARIRWEDVLYIENEIRLKIKSSEVVFKDALPALDFSVRRDVLDQQVVDTDNQKVERVNDVQLLRVDNQLYLAHVDVGLRALVRRLSWTPVVDALVRWLRPQSPYLTHEDFIGWKNTQILPRLGRMRSVLKLDVAKNKLSGIPPAALADIMQDLDIFARLSLFKSLESVLQVKVFTDLSLDSKVDLIDQLSDHEAALLVQSIPADEATDLLMRLPRSKTHLLMRLMGTDTSKKLRTLLTFSKDSAGGLMTTEYLSMRPDATVADAFSKLKENAQFHGGIYFIYIVDENNRWLATTSLRRFIGEDPSRRLIETAHKENVFVYTDDSVEEVALLMEQYKFSSVPVINREEILQGVITMDDVLEELIALVWSKYKEKL